MSEDLAKRLSSLTPDPGGLDRDGLLFEAGRRSAQPNRLWRATAAALALSQAAMLLIFLFALPHRERGSEEPQSPNIAGLAPSSPPLERDSMLMVQRQIFDNGIVSRSPVVENLAPPEPPLHAFGADLDRIAN